MKLVSLGNCFGAPRLYQNIFKRIEILYKETDFASLRTIEKGDVVMFGGGEDISPSIYGQSASKWSYAPATPSMRDTFEIRAYHRAIEVGASCFGICRGAQLLCALSGGKLIQHVTNHGGTHWIDTIDGGKFITSSAHHQMMWPYNLPKDNFKVLGWTDPPRSTCYVFSEGDVKEEIDEEPEVVYFPKTSSLGVQGHPEFMSERAPFVRYSKDLLVQFLIERK